MNVSTVTEKIDTLHPQSSSSDNDKEDKFKNIDDKHIESCNITQGSFKEVLQEDYSITSDIKKHISDAICGYCTEENINNIMRKYTVNLSLYKYLNDKDKKIKELEETNKSMTESENKLKKALVRRIKNIKKEHSKQISKLQKEISEKRTSILSLESKIKEKEEEISRLDSNIKKLQSDQQVYERFFPIEDFNFLKDIFKDIKDTPDEIILTFFALRSEAKNNKDKVRSTFSRFDEALFDYLYEDKGVYVNRLTEIRNALQERLNNEVLNGIYHIEWPAPNSTFDDQLHTREEKGNKIILAKTAIVYDAKGETVITKARVKTG